MVRQGKQQTDYRRNNYKSQVWTRKIFWDYMSFTLFLRIQICVCGILKMLFPMILTRCVDFIFIYVRWYVSSTFCHFCYLALGKARLMCLSVILQLFSVNKLVMLPLINEDIFLYYRLPCKKYGCFLRKIIVEAKTYQYYIIENCSQYQ